MNPWFIEPNLFNSVYRNYEYVIWRHSSFGHLCGYVVIPENNFLHGKNYNSKIKFPISLLAAKTKIDEIGMLNILCMELPAYGYMKMYAAIPTHEGLTFSGRLSIHENKWCIGFDCNHCNDYAPYMKYGFEDETNYKTFEYVEAYCKEMIDRIIDIDNYNNPWELDCMLYEFNNKIDVIIENAINKLDRLKLEF